MFFSQFIVVALIGNIKFYCSSLRPLQIRPCGGTNRRAMVKRSGIE